MRPIGTFGAFGPKLRGAAESTLGFGWRTGSVAAEFLPDFTKSELLRPVVDLGAVSQVPDSGLVEHGADIVEVLFGTPLLIVFELSEDDVFRRSKPGFDPIIDLEALPPGPSPGMEGIVGAEVEVRAETGIVVDDVGVAPLGAREFRKEDFCGSAVEIRFREGGFEPTEGGWGEGKDEIDVVGEPGFTVVHSRHGARDHVVESCGLERSKKEGEKVHVSG